MAFDKQYMTNNTGGSNNESGLGVWSYNGLTAGGSDDDLATIVAAGYFNDFQQVLTSGSESGPLKVGDVILARGSDANAMYIVTGISTNVTIATY